MRELTIVTGEMRSGKTKAARRAYESFRRRGFAALACLELCVRDSAGAPLDLSLQLLPGGEIRHLAARPSRELPFAFREEPFEWVRAMLDPEGRAGIDPLVLDELGPLEILEGRGHLPFFREVLAREDARVVCTVRKKLLEDFLRLIVDSGFGDSGPWPAALSIVHCQYAGEDV